MTLTINRTRSPKYPNFHLGSAVRQVGKIHAADRRNIIERLNAAKHMGYSGLSGPSEKAIGTLVQYGLLELVGKGQVRVSQLAVDTLHPVSDAGRKEALAKAAMHPEIFKALKEQFPEGVSEASLQSYLVRQNFMDRAIAPLSKAYTETCAFLEQSGASDSHRQSATGAPESVVSDDGEDEDPTVYGGARVGDLIQWESGGALQLEKPMRVRLVTDDGQWVVVEGSETGIPMSEVIVQERALAATPPPPRFPLERSHERSRDKAEPGETEWMRNRLGTETKVRLLVTGEMGPREIRKLIKLLEAQRAVLEDDDDEDA